MYEKPINISTEDYPDNVISLDRERRLRELAEFALGFPHMYTDFELSCRAVMSELTWLADNNFIPEGLWAEFEHADTAVRDALKALEDWIQELRDD